MKKSIKFLIIIIFLFGFTTIAKAVTHTVTFHDTYTDTNIIKLVEDGEKVEKPTDPVKPNRVFMYWEIGEIGYDFDNLVTNDLNLESLYGITWTYDVNGGSYVTPEMASYLNGGINVSEEAVVTHNQNLIDEMASIFSAPTGYEFDAVEIGGTRVNYGSTYSTVDYPEDHLTFKLLWKKKKYYVSFYPKGGTEYPNQTVEHGNTATNPGTPVKENRYFKYWYLTTRDEEFNFNTPIVENTILSPYYYVNIHINFNGGVCGDCPGVDEGVIEAEDEHNAPLGQEEKEQVLELLTAPEGYEFDAWEIKGTRYDVGDDVYVNSFFDKDTYGKILWKKKQYTVTFDTKGGSSVSSQVVDHGDLISTPSNPTKDFRNFKCWQKEGESIFGCYDMTTPVTEELSLYAVYTIDYTIDLNGGTVKTGKSFETELQLIDAVGVFYEADVANMNITAPVMYSENTTTPPKYSVIDLQDIDNVEPPAGYEARYNYTYWDDPAPTYFVKTIGKIIVYSKIQYTVTFADRGGSQTTAQVVDHGETIVAPTDPHKDYRDFKCWQKEGEPVTGCYDLSTPVTEDITLYPVYTMKFYIDVGDATIKEGKNYPLERDVYDEDTNLFVNDNYDSFEESVIPPEHHVYDPDRSSCVSRNIGGTTINGVYIPEEPITGWYIMHWICFHAWKLQSYTLTFDTQGGNNIDSVTKKYQETITLPTPTKAGNAFVEWQEKDDQGNVINTYQAGSSYEFTDNKTLYANWSINKVNVTFHVENEETTQQVNYGTKVTKPTDPVKDDYDFTGWYSDSSLTILYDFDSTVLSDMDLYAGFKLTFKAIHGNEDEITKGESDDIVINVLGIKYTFDTVEINGEVVDPSNYDIDETNNTITIHRDYLNTLDTGDYNIIIKYMDGQVDSTLKVVEVKGEEEVVDVIEENPKTGDTIINKIHLLIIGLIGFITIVVYKKVSIKE